MNDIDDYDVFDGLRWLLLNKIDLDDQLASAPFGFPSIALPGRRSRSGSSSGASKRPG
jgi:hypothetical protein